MDPLTATLEAYIATTNLITLVWRSATPEQQKRLLEIHLRREEWWQKRFDDLGNLIAKP